MPGWSELPSIKKQRQLQGDGRQQAFSALHRLDGNGDSNGNSGSMVKIDLILKPTNSFGRWEGFCSYWLPEVQCQRQP